MNKRRLELTIRALEQDLERLKSERNQAVELYNETHDKLNQAQKENRKLQESYHELQLEKYEQTWLNQTENEPYEDENTCLECSSWEEQYHQIRSAFDRRKQQHQAIAKFFKHYHFTHNGQRMSLTKLIKFGQELQ
ncbi:hypothetical protein [uncultured Vibrio sp.]|uniref:hypothetical protein n=1 Tax=uncultured Vibrio sp. TaxID=114054 RepID=UPI00260C0C23|nr:hypothetical protein [uncultured Vibrio sp.]